MAVNLGAIGKRVGTAIKAGIGSESDSSSVGRKVGSGLRKGVKYGIGKLRTKKPATKPVSSKVVNV